MELSFLLYASAEELAGPDQALLAHARTSLEHSYSPYSRFKVGAAVRLANGEVMGGSNYENAAYPLCICAEQSLLAAVASRYPGVAVTDIAITVKSADHLVTSPAAPCGGCRQVICETERKNRHDIRILLQGETGPVYVFERGTDLLPLAFGGEFLTG